MSGLSATVRFLPSRGLVPWAYVNPFRHWSRPKPDLFPKSKVEPELEALMRHLDRLLEGPPLLERPCPRKLTQAVKIDQSLPALPVTVWDSLAGLRT